jgi:hypothetical protein
MITDMKFSVFNLALGGGVGAGSPHALSEIQYYRQYQEEVPVGVWKRGDMMDSLCYFPTVHKELLVGLKCPEESDEEGHLDA